jgi:transcription elongation factor Elf1
MRPDCQHDLQINVSSLLKDGRNPMSVFCGKCGRGWDCESINFAKMGDEPKWVPNET